jgi:hypothetical protein
VPGLPARLQVGGRRGPLRLVSDRQMEPDRGADRIPEVAPLGGYDGEEVVTFATVIHVRPLIIIQITNRHTAHHRVAQMLSICAETHVVDFRQFVLICTFMIDHVGLAPN